MWYNKLKSKLGESRMAEKRALPIKTKEETDVLAFKINNNDPANRNAADFNPDDFADQRIDGQDDIFEVADVTSALVEGAEDHEDMLFWDANAFDWNNNELKDVKSWGRLTILPNETDLARATITSTTVVRENDVDDDGFSEANTDIVFTGGSSSEDPNDSALETTAFKFHHKQEDVVTPAYLEGAFEGSFLSNKLTARDAPILEGNTSNMFKDCTQFDLHLKNWDFGNVTDSVGMFDNCTAMTQDIFRKNLQRMNQTKSDEVGMPGVKAKVVQYIGAKNVYVNGQTLEVIDDLNADGQVVTDVIVIGLAYGIPSDVWVDSKTYKIGIPIKNVSYDVPLNITMSVNNGTETKTVEPRGIGYFEATLNDADTMTGSTFAFQFQGTLVTKEDAPSTDVLTMVFEVPVSPGGEPPTDDKELITWDEIEIPWNTTKYTWDGALITA
jgi:hypothetical protein